MLADFADKAGDSDVFRILLLGELSVDDHSGLRKFIHGSCSPSPSRESGDGAGSLSRSSRQLPGVPEPSQSRGGQKRTIDDRHHVLLTRSNTYTHLSTKLHRVSSPSPLPLVKQIRYPPTFPCTTVAGIMVNAKQPSHVVGANGSSGTTTQWCEVNNPAGLAASQRRLRMVCIGGGIAGIHHAKKFGNNPHIDYQCYEREPSVGGVWYLNKYPGLCCDIPSHVSCSCEMTVAAPTARADALMTRP